MANMQVKDVLDGINYSSIELKPNGYYLVDTGDAFIFVNSQCDINDASMYVGLPGVGGDITPNDYSGRPYYEMFDSDDTTRLGDFNIIPKNMYVDTSKYIKALDDSDVNVTNAVFNGYSGSVPAALDISDEYVASHPEIQTNIYLDDFDFSGKSHSNDYYKVDVSKYTALSNSPNVSFYCIQHAGVNWGERDAQLLSENGFDNVALITTNSNNHGNINYDIIKSNIIPATTGLVNPSKVGGISRNEGVGDLTFNITRYEDGKPVSEGMSVNSYVKNYVGTTTNSTVTLEANSSDFDMEHLFSSFKTSAGGVRIYRDELDAFLKSSMVSSLKQDLEDTKGLSNLIKSFRNNKVLKGDSWKLAYDKLEIFDNALTERMNAADELGEAIQYAITTLQKCMDDYDMMDTSQLPELKIVYDKLVIEQENLQNNIKTGATKIVSKGLDEDGEEILETVPDEDQMENWKNQLAEVNEQMTKAKKLITALEDLQKKYEEIEKVLDAAMAKVASFGSSVGNIPPSLRYTYTPVTTQI